MVAIVRRSGELQMNLKKKKAQTFDLSFYVFTHEG